MAGECTHMYIPGPGISPTKMREDAWRRARLDGRTTLIHHHPAPPVRGATCPDTDHELIEPTRAPLP